MCIQIEIITCRGKPSLWHRLKQFFTGSYKIYVNVPGKRR